MKSQNKIILWTALIISISLTNGCELKSKKISNKPLPAFNPKDFSPGRIYDISSEHSEIKIYVYRGGALAALGHNHIITSNNIDGKIYRHKDVEQSGFEFNFPVNKLIIDNAADRHEAGPDFSSTPSDKDISGTRLNMLSEKLLHSEQFPNIQVTSVSLRTNSQRIESTLRIRIKNTTCDIQAPFNFNENAQKISITGELEFSQQHCNLTPFSILMGAIAVKDILKIKYHFVAKLT